MTQETSNSVTQLLDYRKEIMQQHSVVQQQFCLETNRLILRPVSFADAASIQAAASIRAVADAMISIPHPYPVGEAKRYIARQIADFEAGQAFSFVGAVCRHGTSGVFPCAHASRSSLCGCAEQLLGGGGYPRCL
ncbi:hypothetical protein [Leptolyngbya sp. 7M]|uniref:hypothetical protein n=1 Tax=Leptolyngbya sp. 7M TaxID=2812896 RepID=UPI001B8B9023|nr:hypothetical protein [Leptolyngbya sp. 7M]QYO64561.1 hypothetical protein JVX88_33765 [Leptolyngbya sp. 7M]